MVRYTELVETVCFYPFLWRVRETPQAPPDSMNHTDLGLQFRIA